MHPDWYQLLELAMGLIALFGLGMGVKVLVWDRLPWRGAHGAMEQLRIDPPAPALLCSPSCIMGGLSPTPGGGWSAVGGQVDRGASARSRCW